MNKLLTIFIFTLSVSSYGQSGEWTWMNGDSAQIPNANYGTQGVFDSLNTPPALYEACEWTDLQGNFWLFGGANNYSDLWKFNPSINQWSWIKGPGIINQWGIYGTKGIPSPNNNPGARSWGCATWTDLNNNLWLFGGIAYDVNGNANEMNDLWKYNISTNEWTWMNGADTIHSSGVYGIKGISSPANTPPCMWENNGSWTDSNNSLWLFGGKSYAHQNASLNTLWKYNISTNQWTWVNGIDSGYAQAIYGIKGIASPLNNPGSRTVYSKWKDSNDNLWFFGGGYDAHQKNDLWKYNISTDEWTWISGDSATIGNVGLDTICNQSINNIPGGRYENRACWIRECDNLALYGGFGASGRLGDLWNYKISTDEWSLISGDIIINTSAVFGTKGISSPANKPNASAGSIGWKDIAGNLWLFGGTGGGNTLWRYISDTTCQNPCSLTSIMELNDMKNFISFFPNPFHSVCTLETLMEFDNAELRIFNILGVLVRKETLFKQTIYKVHRNELTAGIYLFQLITDNGNIAISKVVIE